jgi:circadian clock protein KaiC
MNISGEVLEKSPTGILGFDEITGGGLPKGRPTLISGGPGSGKTVFGAEYIVRGITEYNEPGVIMTFEETGGELEKNFTSMGFDLGKLEEQKKLVIDYVYIERGEIEETGDYDLEGLFVRMAAAIDAVGARRVMLDTVEALFSGFSNAIILRAELRRLFRWLKEKGVTVVITGEKGEGTLTRFGIEEYVADCVIVLDNRMIDQISTRRLRILKYRGTVHGTNEYPFLIGPAGISLFPITSVGLDYAVSSAYVSSGIPRLDAMLGGKGYYRGSSILLSGTAGSGKSSFAGKFAESECSHGRKALYFAMEESEQQILRNMCSIGIDLATWVDKKRLLFYVARPTLTGLEQYLVNVHRLVNEFKPDAVVIDPISSLTASGLRSDVKLMLTRMLDFLKGKGITSCFTDLTKTSGVEEESATINISSLMDTWIMLTNSEINDMHVRKVRVIKSRGMANSSLSYRFRMSDQGIHIEDVLQDVNKEFVRNERELSGSVR